MVWLIITPMRWGFRKDLPNWFLVFRNNAFPGSDVFISHSNCLSKAKQLEEAILRAAPSTVVRIGQMRGTMCTHAGPDTIGLFFYQEQFI